MFRHWVKGDMVIWDLPKPLRKLYAWYMGRKFIKGAYRAGAYYNEDIRHWQRRDGSHYP